MISSTTSTGFLQPADQRLLIGVYQPIDKSKLTNWKNLDEKILGKVAEADPDNNHAVPYLHGVNGFAYNVDMIKARMPNAPVNSLDMIFNPEIVSPNSPIAA